MSKDNRYHRQSAVAREPTATPAPAPAGAVPCPPVDVQLASGQAHDVKDTLVAAFGPANLARLVHHLHSQQRAARLRVLSAGQGVVDPTACLHPHTSGAARPEDDTPARGHPRHNRKEQS